MDRADGHDRRVLRADLARNDRLERRDDARGDDDRVDGRLGGRAVPAPAVDRDGDPVGVGEREARRDADLAGRQPGAVVESDGEVGLRNALEEAIADHRQGPAAALLRGLPDEDERSAPAGLGPREQGGRADERGHVDVVPAGMHDRNGLAGLGLRRRGARVGKARFLGHGQGVHVGPEKQSRALAVAHHGDDTGLPQAGRDLVAERAELLGELARAPNLLVGELGIAVKVDVERLELGVELRQRGDHRGGGRGREREQRRGGSGAAGGGAGREARAQKHRGDRDAALHSGSSAADSR